MCISSISKILVCIYTCEKDLYSVVALKKTDWFKDVSSRENFKCIQVLADESISDEYVLENETLTLKTEESYTNLCIKSFKMIKACKELFDFDFLLKVDGNIVKNNHNKTSSFFSFDYFLQKFYSGDVIGEYNGLTPIVGNTIKQFRNWAYMKNLTVMPEFFIISAGQDRWVEEYCAGGCYCLGLNSINTILQQPELFNKFKNFMAGCEDMAIASALNK